MRNGEVTPVTTPRVTPVVYLDLDITPSNDVPSDALEARANEAAYTTGYPGLQAMLLAAHGPSGGNPVFRVEGPLPQLVKWLKDHYGATAQDDSLESWIGDMGLAK